MEMLLTDQIEGFFHAEGIRDQETTFFFYKTGKLGEKKIGVSHFIEQESYKALILCLLQNRYCQSRLYLRKMKMSKDNTTANHIHGDTRTFKHHSTISIHLRVLKVTKPSEVI